MLMDAKFLDKVWGEILSHRPARIKRMFTSLDASSQLEVLEHLKKMVTEEGWQEVQIISAQVALKVINSSKSKKI